MAKRPLIEAEKRSVTGKRAVRKLREEGKVPAVIYGPDRDTENLSVSVERMQEIIDSRSHTVEVRIGSKTQPAVVKQVQFDHLGSDIYHVDFESINLAEIVRVQVAIETHGTAKGTRNGGVLDVVHRHVTVECAAGDVPNEVMVEVADLDIDSTVTVAQLVLPEGVKVVDEPTAIVVIVHPPRAAEAVTAEVVEGEAAEPEVITRKGAEGEEEAEEE